VLKKHKYFIPSYLFAGLILVGASISTRELHRIRRIHEIFRLLFSEYSLHFFGFGIFAVLVAWGYYKTRSFSIIVRAGLVSFCFGFLIEVYQGFLSYRDFSLVDVSVDGAGVAAALLVFWFVVLKKHLFGL